MSASRIGFKRMVVGLPQSMANSTAMKAAADLAEFLHIDFLGTFVADPSFRALAGLSSVREWRDLDQGWQAIDTAQIERDIEYAISLARRNFAESVGSRRLKTSFDVITEPRAMSSLIRAGDIVAIIEPTHPGERITRQFIGLLNATFDTAAAILVVPKRIVRLTGSIMAMAAGPEDESIRVALDIATAVKERLIVVTPGGAALSPEILADAERSGVPVERIVASGPAAYTLALTKSSSLSKERLRVAARNQLPGDASRVFSTLHGVPLLLIEPDRLQRERGR
jgi:hypothetical protein